MTAEGREPERPPAPGPGLLGPRIAAAVLVAVGALLVVSAFGIARGGGYTVIGPATVPLVVAIGLAVLGALFVLRTTVRPDHELAERAADEERVTHWPTAGLAAVALVLYALALDGVEVAGIEIPGLGYVVATAIFLPITARILGSRALLRDAIAGLVLALVVYFGFTEFLGIRLPAGLLGPVL
jgi:putative tricarboxylic transport membrane protein